jgi:hypothetical protein
MCNPFEHSISRRRLLTDSVGFGFLGLGAKAGLLHAEEAPELAPRFFLHINIFGGFDGSYLFDSRPRSFVTAGKKALYLKQEPTVWTGVNGGQCWATTEAMPLKEFADYFTVLNGVHMATGFDGHDQNSNFLATGNPFGGEYFVPHLNQAASPMLLDFIKTGFFFPFETTNSQNGVPFNAFSANALVTKVKAASDSRLDQARRFVERRMQVAASGNGKLAAGAGQMLHGLSSAPKLEKALSHMELGSPENTLGANLGVVAQVFKRGLSRSAFVSLDFLADSRQMPVNADAHAATDAKRGSELAALVVERFIEILRFLRSNTYDEKRSLLDVTTVLLSTEFGRTMRQYGVPVEESGTDHNSLTNSLILAGAGVRGGQVIGASDFQTVDEAPTGAHLQLDRDQMKQMGLPFDHAAAKVRTDRPDGFRPADYLGMANVANSIMSSFGVKSTHQWLTERNGSVAPVIHGLFA